jgi:hypothetical protein
MKPLLITSQADIVQHIERCQLRIDQCRDVIKQLTGAPPNAFTFTFSVGDTKIVSFEIADDESEFTISYFMSWHQFYSKRLSALNKML